MFLKKKLSEMRLRLQRVHFQLQSLMGKIKGFLSFNSLGEMIFWDVDSCQTAKPVKNYQTKIVFIFPNFLSIQLNFLLHLMTEISTPVKGFFPASMLSTTTVIQRWTPSLFKLTINNTVPLLLTISSLSILIVIFKSDAAVPDLWSRCHQEGSLHI